MKWMCPILLLAVAAVSYAGAENVVLASRMYGSARAWEVGDLLTVLVDESTSSSKQEAQSSSKSAKDSADPTSLGSETGKTWLTKKLADVEIPTYSINASSSFAGSGSSSSSEKLTASFTVRVTDVLENGVLLVHGSRNVLIRKEEVEMVLTGLVRRRDVTSANTVYSSKIADAHIFYKTSGDTTRGSNPGWFWRAFQVVSPF